MSTATLANGPPAPPASSSKLGAVLRVTSGNFLEKFDFFLFGFYATYIAKAFFPASSEFASLMLTFATFGAGFLMRPLGAIVLGAYIDQVGRRKGLIVTLAIMASGTVLIAFVPGYATIGLVAPVLVLLGRLLQGFSAGVELGGVSVYLAEMATPGHKGFYVAWQSASQQVAIVLAAALGFALNEMLSPADAGRLGLAHPVLHRLHDHPVPLRAAPLAAGDRGLPGPQAPPDDARGVPVDGAQLARRAVRDAAGRDDHHHLLPDHGLHADLRQAPCCT